MIMNLESLKSLTEIKNFLSGAHGGVFEVTDDKKACYAFIERALNRFCYRHLKKAEKGIMVVFLQRITGYSRQQLTRLINQYQKTGKVVIKQKTLIPFVQKYTKEDILRLCKMDELHETPSGGVMKKLFERARKQCPSQGYERLAQISISHLYNLRKKPFYLRQGQRFEKTKATRVAVGERKKPIPYGMPGYLRIDTVHQGDLDGIKGVYYINAIDEVTQFEIIVCVEKISEAYLVPALQFILDSFPFKIRGFHSDNGSEYINKTVCSLLQKLQVEFTKSRPRHSGDNGLVESKNGSIIRKQFGYAHIPQHFAQTINHFNREYLNPYVNFHRPCYFPTEIINKKGKIIKKYNYCDTMTPFEKLKSLTNFNSFLKSEQTLQMLEAQANALTDNQAAQNLLEHRTLLFNILSERSSLKAS